MNAPTSPTPPAYTLLAPTRARPDLFIRMVESAVNTMAVPERLQILVYVDDDDPARDAYAERIDAFRARLPQGATIDAFVGESVGAPRSVNWLLPSARGQVLLSGADDQVYLTQGWDLILDEAAARHPDGVFMAWFDDGLQGENLATHPVLGRRWVESLGYYYPFVFEHFCADTWLTELARRIGRACYLPQAKVEHRHYLVQKATIDETYRRNISQGPNTTGRNSRYARDNEVYRLTLPYRELDAVRLRHAIAAYKPGA